MASLSVGKRSTYIKVLKRKAGVLLPTSSAGPMPPIVNPTDPSCPPKVFNQHAPLQLPDKRFLVLKGPKPLSRKQTDMSATLVSGNIGLFGDLNRLSQDNPELSVLRDGLAQSLVQSRAVSTFGKYMPLVDKWENFSTEMNSPPFPASASLFILYLQKLKGIAESKGTKGFNVPDSVYAVDFAHRLRGLPLPGSYAPIRLLCNATKRLLSRPVVKKRPIEKAEVIKMLDHAVPDFNRMDVGDMRAALFAVLAFCLEARFDDICDLSLSSFFDYGDYFIVYIEHRKTDQYREGQFVPIYDNMDPRGACAFLRAALPVLGAESSSLSSQSVLPILRRIGNGAKRGKYLRPEGLAYSRVRELVRDLLLAIGLDPNNHGLHSFRAGAATHAANEPGISDSQWGKHGGWCPGSTAQIGYVHDSAARALEVPKALAL
jgi:hypothetical protein